MLLSASWIRKGYFDFTGLDHHRTPTILIRKALSRSLGLPPGGLRTKSYPVGPSWRHTFWWRQGEVDSAEAQFFLSVAGERPALSLGISVEKGLEDGGQPLAQMDRSLWDWPRFVERSSELMSAAVPACVGNQAPFDVLTLRLEIGGERPEAFTFTDRDWYSRRVGAADVPSIVERIRELDAMKDRWVTAWLSFDLAASEAAAMSADEVAAGLLRLEPVRQAVRRR